MKFFFGVNKSLLIMLVFILLIVGNAIRMSPHHYTSVSNYNGSESYGRPKEREGEEIEMVGVVYPRGSSIPDCTHACGPCFPCKRVMVSFKCSLAESCPIVYRCMCKGKYYHVPSN